MISNGEVIRSLIKIDELTEVMLGKDWWENPKYDRMQWWDNPYPSSYRTVRSSAPISNGEVITADYKRVELIEIMVGWKPLWFGGHSPYNPKSETIIS